MKKLLLSAGILALLGGCAHQAPKTLVAPHVTKAPVVKPAPVAKPAPVQPATPNAVVKRRWYDRFKIHPHWFR